MPGGNDAPTAPDYRGVAQEQGEQSRLTLAQQTNANRANQYGPGGSSTWQSYNSVDPTTGENVTSWQNEQQLDAAGQHIFDQQRQNQSGDEAIRGGLQGQTANNLAENPNFQSNMPAWAQNPNVPDFYGTNLPSMGSVPGRQDITGQQSGGMMGGSTGGQPPQQGGTGGSGQPPPPPQPAGIGGLYNEILGREGGQAGMDYWQGQLDSGAMDMNQIREGFINSAENQGRENPYQQGDGGQTSTQPMPFTSTPPGGGDLQAHIRPAKTAENNEQMANQQANDKAMADKRAQMSSGLPPQQGQLQSGSSGGMYDSQASWEAAGSPMGAQGGQQGPQGGQPPPQQQQQATPPMNQGVTSNSGMMSGTRGGDVQRELGNGGSAGARNRAESAIYDRGASRMDPQWEQQTTAKKAELAGRGLRPGDKAYETAMGNFDRSKNDAYQGLNQEAISRGGQEASRTFGMDMQGGQFQNQAQQQAFNQDKTLRGEAGAGSAAQFDQGMRQQEAMDAQRRQLAQEQLSFGNQGFNQQMDQARFQADQRNNYIGEEYGRQNQAANLYNSMRGGQQIQSPQFQNAPYAGQAQGANLMGAAQNQYGGQIDAYNAQNMNRQGMMSGMGDLFGSLWG